MEKMKNKLMPPLIGWVYRDKDTKKVCRAGDFWGLVELVARHRRANDLEVRSDLADEIEAELCKFLPDDQVIGRELGKVTVEARMRRSGGKTNELFCWWVRQGRVLVSKGEAERRAAVCQSCEHNIREGCLSCMGIDSWVYGFLGGDRRTAYDKMLGICGVNDVYLMALVHMVTDGGIPCTRGADGCWLSVVERNGG